MMVISPERHFASVYESLFCLNCTLLCLGNQPWLYWKAQCRSSSPSSVLVNAAAIEAICKMPLGACTG